ncbi:Lrp/AsnC family transcriptional regulator [Stappia sp.]|jgi:Lrp/AsnC family leucine-responsive transcriptional regulator|uniref:Lrp/AsnC family transcriptional regulator n=1 Tax=Stappia sp. TaxID=1870903 RepID=UPI003A9A6127
MAGSARKSVKLDDHDIALLNLVQENNLLTAEQMAARVSLSPSACQRRLRKLRDAGVIRADVALLDPAAVGPSVTTIVHVSLERERLDLLEAFRAELSARPEVTQCYYVTGDADFVLVVVTPDMEAYGAFTERAFFANANVRSFQTYTVMKTVKATMKVPLS